MWMVRTEPSRVSERSASPVSTRRAGARRSLDGREHLDGEVTDAGEHSPVLPCWWVIETTLPDSSRLKRTRMASVMRKVIQPSSSGG